MAGRHCAPDQPQWATSFIGSFFDGPGRVLIVLRGGIDVATVERLEVHIGDAMAGDAELVTIDAAAVESYDPMLLDLLDLTQRRLHRTRRTLQVHGLHPGVLTGPYDGTSTRVLSPALLQTPGDNA